MFQENSDRKRIIDLSSAPAGGTGVKNKRPDRNPASF
jgi:hypothetical protein